MILTIQEFFQQYWKWFLEAYLIIFVVIIPLRFILKNKRTVFIGLVYAIILGILFLARYLELKVVYNIYYYLMLVYPVGAFVFFSSDIKKGYEAMHNKNKKITLLSSSIKTKNEVADACMYLSKKRIGALITIEKHNSLDQFASKAIKIDSEVSKELIINIFTPYTPLHDGAVIIRGNRIRCAGAYYNLTDNQDDIDKTTGSRHRAALGISEVTDSLTICVSEETGDISLATEGLMIEANDKNKLLEYLDLFLQ
ncbi:MAG: DNA integrity scanning protein DisA nucleotide-binding domain protein [Bacilli bacterium]|nr:DNA integrity scanning protein DisA nucleotide-binding domain protein [Bacilli bacterium]